MGITKTHYDGAKSGVARGAARDRGWICLGFEYWIYFGPCARSPDAKFKHHNLEDLYQGKYSLKKKDEDLYIFNKAINFRDEIKPRLPMWLEKKILINTETEKKSFYNSILSEPRFDIAVNIMKYSRDDVINVLKKHNIISSYTKNSTVGMTVNSRIPKCNEDHHCCSKEIP